MGGKTAPGRALEAFYTIPLSGYLDHVPEKTIPRIHHPFISLRALFRESSRVCFPLDLPKVHILFQGSHANQIPMLISCHLLDFVTNVGRKWRVPRSLNHGPAKWSSFLPFLSFPFYSLISRSVTTHQAKLSNKQRNPHLASLTTPFPKTPAL